MTAAPEPGPLSVRLLHSPHTPEPPQAAYLKLGDLGVLEALYGGAAGGGKSDCLLMAALQYVDVPGYAALLLRRSYTDLALPGAIMARSKEWLMGTEARWSEVDFRWTFPRSGATLSFGYLRTFNDVYRYQSAEFQFIGFDELTQFSEAEYRYLFTRLRRPSSDADANAALGRVPLRIRGASNPGGRGHEWVKRRFILKLPDPDDPQDTAERARRRIFIPARLKDNPHVDRQAYTESLNNVDPYLRAQMLDGDWDAREPGDWVYDQLALDAAFARGDYYDELLEQGTMPPPVGDQLAIGIDWGENTAALIGWPLERGGLYIAAETQLELSEPTASAEAIIEELELVRVRGARPRPAGWQPIVSPAQEIARRRRATGEPPALRADVEALTLVSDHRYDAAGVQSMRTYTKTVRRRHPNAKTTAVPFGAPAPISGKSASRRSYKAETIGYLRRLLEHTRAQAEGIDAYLAQIARPGWTAQRHDLERKRILGAGELAISRRCPELRRQTRKTEWLDRDKGAVRKGDDHTADALIALAAPHAIRYR